MELNLAARMAAVSCMFMFWQQAEAVGNKIAMNCVGNLMVAELQKLDADFNAYWPLRNKATAKHCSSFLQWRIEELTRTI